jgi:SWI/SNF-related matrix-associated actin-dependent regulator of chromatin subfamily A-like protein 1
VRLDFNSATRAFNLYLEAGVDPSPSDIVLEHGFDWSEPASTPQVAVCFTREPYAAVPFWDYATEAALTELRPLRELLEDSWRSTGLGHVDCPPDEQPWPFQIDGVHYALRRKNTLFGDQPGLGKSCQAIITCNEMRARRVLLICPANIRLQWAKMIRRWSTMPWPFNVYVVLTGSQGVHPKAEWTVVSYDLAGSPAICAALVKGTYDAIILDEAHYLKTIDTRRTRAVFGGGDHRLLPSLASRAGAILALTGTPLPNRPREAFTLARGLCPDAIDFMSEEAFTTRFNPSMRREGRGGKLFTDERTGRHGELQSRLRANFMVRREKHGPHGVLQQLKLPLYDIVHIEADGPVKAALRAESMLEIDVDRLPGPDDPKWGQIATARRIMGVAVAPHAADYVQMVLDGGEEKVVVFGHHIEVLDILEAKLRRYGVVRIDGRTGPSRKQALVDQFRQGQSCRVCLGNMLSMGTGTDGLQDVSCHAIFAEADWTPGVNQQGVDRLDRGGQLREVQADFLVAPGSLSETVLATALNKNKTTHKALDLRL